MVRGSSEVTPNIIPNYITMSHGNTSIEQLIDTVKTLRSPDGCPWDRKQTTFSMTKYLRSEFQEVLDAITNNDPDNLCEELGDLLYIIVMISEINQEQDLFDFEQVTSGITKKLIRRHPHVFGDAMVSGEQELRDQWERIKNEEKAGK